MTNIDLLVVEKHTVDGFDGSISRLSRLVVNETIALGTTLLIGGDFARKDVAKGRKGIMQSLSRLGINDVGQRY